MKEMKFKIIFLISISIILNLLFLFLISSGPTTPPNIAFEDPTPADSSTHLIDSMIINISASDSENNISTFIDFDRTLVVWWTMDDVDAFNVYDSSGYGNNGAINADADQTDAGYLGKAFEFDGTGDNIFMSALDFADEISVCAWVNTSDFSGIMVHQNNFALQISGGSSNWRTNTDTATKNIFSINISTSTWQHICGVYNGSNMMVYNNGSLVNQTAQSGNLLGSSGNFYVGSQIDGIIDDVMVFERALSSEEIISLYANKSSEYLSHNFTLVGTHKFKAYSQDLAGNINETEERTITRTNITGCANLGLENLTYTQGANIADIESSPCINITAKNIIFDCNGYWISNTTLAYIGIQANNLNITIKNCNITMKNADGGYGIKLSFTNNSHIYNNTINGQYYGLLLHSSSNNLIKNNTIKSNNLYAIYLNDSDNNIFTNNDIWNCSSASHTCIMLRESEYNTFNNNKINESSNYGIQIWSSGYSGGYKSSSHNVFKNTNMTNIDGTSVDFYDYGGSYNENNTFLNFSYYNESVDSNSELIRKWYFQPIIYLNNSESFVPINNSNVSLYDKTNVFIVSNTTNSNGLTSFPQQELTEYINDGGTKNYYTPKLTMSAIHYYDGGKSFDLTALNNVFDAQQLFLAPVHTSLNPGPSPIAEEEEIVVEEFIAKGICGNGLCEPGETFYNCQEDCGGLNLDDLILSCFSKDPAIKSRCIINQSPVLFYIALGVIGFILVTIYITKKKGEKTIYAYPRVKRYGKKFKSWLSKYTK